MSQPAIEILTSPHFVDWLHQSRISLLLTTYQTNRLFLIGTKPNGHLSVFERHFDRPMGLWASPERLVMSTRWQIWELANVLDQGERHKGDFDALFVPRVAHTTGRVDTHDIGVDADDRIVFVNTSYSCLATTSSRHSFTPIWQPPFISQLAPEDRCHLNGLAMHEGEPAYVTAVNPSDTVSGWRNRRHAGGCLVDVASGETVHGTLSMPHSPRVHDGHVWVLNSGTGQLGRIDLAAGRFDPVAFLPGFLRGLAFVDDLAVVGLSQRGEERTFNGLPLDDRLADKASDARCGVHVVDTTTGSVAHWMEFEGVVRELYDVQVLHGVACPTALGFKSDEIQRLVTVEALEQSGAGGPP